MAKTTKSDPAAVIMSAMTDWPNAGLGPVNWMGTAWVEGMSKIGNEVTRFVSERIQEDLETQKKVLACRDPAELQSIQMAFLTKAFEQYSAETGKLAEMNREMMAEIMSASVKETT